MLIHVHIQNYPSTFDLAVIRWYDFKHRNERRMSKYNCPLLTLLDDYQCIPVESIVCLTHIIPRFDKENEYFVNNFLF